MNPVREVFGGFGVLLRGLAIVLRRPRLFLLGALPALITSLLFLAALVTLAVNLTDLVAWATPFAREWDTVWQGLLRGALSVGLLAGAVLVMVVAFTTVTLGLGAPIYDKIAELVEQELGGAPEAPEESLAAGLVRSIRQSVGIVLVSLLVTVGAFLLGLIPLVGWMVGPVLTAVMGGWLLGVELTASAFDRRGLLLVRDRRHFMGTRRWRVLGFAVPTYFLLAIPFVAVAVFPAATAGGTILARELLPDTPQGSQPPQDPRTPAHPHSPPPEQPQGPQGAPQPPRHP
ncbi:MULTISPECIES: EI24 domain-containing protein [unclassified Nocardiopsis]|uniref:EI24 domain-containing protein n=1 Tax=unclassified Nocardiopsis TaxID=2649073 RepID=UPI00066AC625|nr:MULTISPECIES: EI24 domain-containing protein [unclassified Nocardiopsis]MBQ1081518.1 EI24 domain-containing protein [Nocardiopsis sp. B62]